jgi:type 1 fimbriae regulatory protein FimB/type 1 fimbriae regulatory protein FimE
MLQTNKRPPPHKLKNKERRSREYLLPAEVRQLIEAAKKLGRHGHRDAVLIMMAYRHALRVGELVNLRWDQVNFSEAGLTQIDDLNTTSSSRVGSAHPTCRGSA